MLVNQVTHEMSSNETHFLSLRTMKELVIVTCSVLCKDIHDINVFEIFLAVYFNWHVGGF